MTSCTGSARGGFGEFWKCQLSSASGEDGWLSLACRGLVSGAHVVWDRWKNQVYLSPYVEKPLNSNVIKSFVPELRSRKCFRVSGFLCSMHICYEHSMYVSHIHVWLYYNIGWTEHWLEHYGMKFLVSIRNFFRWLLWTLVVITDITQFWNKVLMSVSIVRRYVIFLMIAKDTKYKTDDIAPTHIFVNPKWKQARYG